MIAAASAIAVMLGGCGAGRPSQHQPRPGERPLLTEGRRVFVSSGCGGCHTVASVHAHGQYGPNFDTSEQLDREMIRTQLDYGGGGMPSFRGRLSARQEDAVIEFVFQTLHQ